MLRFTREDFEADRDILNKMKMFVELNLEGEFKLTRGEYNRIAHEYEYEWQPSMQQESTHVQRPEQSDSVSEIQLGEVNYSIGFDPITVAPAFFARLANLIDNCKIPGIEQDADLYKRAGISRSLFARYRNGAAPGKDKVIAIALALRLNLAETKDLLESAGFSLSRAYIFDEIIRCAIIDGEYDVYVINTVLSKYNQPELPQPNMPIDDYKNSVQAAKRG
jgi:hypothetical protein